MRAVLARLASLLVVPLVSAYEVPPTLQGRAIHNLDGTWILVGPHWTGGVVQSWSETEKAWVNLTDPAGVPVYQAALDFGQDSYPPSDFVAGISPTPTGCYNEKREYLSPAAARPWWPYTRYWSNGTPYPGQQLDIKGKVTFIA